MLTQFSSLDFPSSLPSFLPSFPPVLPPLILCFLGLTGHVLKSDVEEYVGKGATHVFKKPLNKESLFEALCE